MNKFILTALAMWVGSISLSCAYAQTPSPQEPTLKQTMASLKESCKDDIKKYCSDVTPGQGRVAACIKSQENHLSTTCKSAWVGARKDISKRIDKADVAFRKSCGADVQKFCSNVPSGEGRLMNCLDQHESDLSSSCKNFQVRLDKKLDEAMS